MAVDEIEPPRRLGPSLDPPGTAAGTAAGTARFMATVPALSLKKKKKFGTKIKIMVPQ